MNGSREAAARHRTPIAALGLYALLCMTVVPFAFPFFWMLATSLKELPQVFAYPPVWLPDPIRWANYPEALTRVQPFGLYFRNTAILVFWVVIGEVLSSSFVGYGFARIRFPGRDALFIVLLSTMMIPFVVRLVPLFVIYQKLGWINTFLPLIVPSFLGTPFLIFLMRQFYRTVPQELHDAARIDGCSELGVWWRVFVPLSKPALAVVAVFAFQSTWNDFMAPLIFLNDQSKKTVILGLYGMIGTGGATQWWNLVMAAAVTIVAPVIAVYLVSQRFMTEGITLSGLKG
jgi:multiple sugar transport system permease protein